MHRSLRLRVAVSVAFAGTLVVTAVLADLMVRTHDQDVTIHSAMPDGRKQVIGMRHRTYLLDYGGPTDLVLFGTTISTGVLTYGRRAEGSPADAGGELDDQWHRAPGKQPREKWRVGRPPGD